MRILLTGSNGYVAKSFHKRFNNQYEITCLNRNIIDLADTNKVDQFFNENEKFDFVLHTAIKGGNRLIQDSSEILDQNIQIYLNLIKNKQRYNKFINLGSGAEIYQKDTFYGLSKKVINESLKDKVNFFNIRIFGVFDENEENRRFIKNNIINYINKKNLIIHQDKKMDFFYMQDLLSLIDFYINSLNPPKEIDCTYENSYFLSEIANIINQLDLHKSNIIIQNNDNSSNYIGKYQKTINFIGLTEGIKNTYKKILST